MQQEAKMLLIGLPVALILAAAAGSAAYFRSRAENLSRENEAVLGKLRTLERQLEEAQSERRDAVSPAVIPARVERGGATADAAQLATLQARVTELEAALLERDRLIASIQNRSTNRAPRVFGGPGGQGRDRTSGLEELQRTDPQRYEEITRAREEMRQRTSEAFAKKVAHFSAQDPKTMSEEQKAQYERLVQLLNDSWALSERLRADPPAEERTNIYRALGQNMVELGPLLEAERQRQFMELALRVGYKADEAQEFVAYLNQILEATSLRSLFPGMRGGTWGFRGEGRGRGRTDGGRAQESGQRDNPVGR